VWQKTDQSRGHREPHFNVKRCETHVGALQCVAVCCSVSQCVAECCSVLQCVAGVCDKKDRPESGASGTSISMSSSATHVLVRCSVLHVVAVCCSVSLECVTKKTDQSRGHQELQFQCQARRPCFLSTTALWQGCWTVRLEQPAFWRVPSAVATVWTATNVLPPVSYVNVVMSCWTHACFVCRDALHVSNIYMMCCMYKIYTMRRTPYVCDMFLNTHLFRTSWYRVAKTHRMPYLYRSFSAK